VKIRFSILILVIAVFAGFSISGCRNEKAAEVLSQNNLSSNLSSNQSVNNGYFDNFSVTKKTVSADKIYNSTDSTSNFETSNNTSGKSSSQLTTSSNQTKSTSSVSSDSQNTNQYS
jgi:hypothetical protein